MCVGGGGGGGGPRGGGMDRCMYCCNPTHSSKLYSLGIALYPESSQLFNVALVNLV